MTLSRPRQYVIQQYRVNAEEFDAKARAATDLDSAESYASAAKIARAKADELEQAA